MPSQPSGSDAQAVPDNAPLPVDRRELWYLGLWRNNAALVQLLGLCPLLAVSNSLINGLGLGLATLFVLAGSSLVISAIRPIVRQDLRIPLYVLVISSLVSVVDIVMQGWWFELHLTLGLFIPLIVTNCLILGRAEAFASRHQPLDALLDALAMGLGFLFVLLVLGGVRELLGNGTLLSQAESLFGESAASWQFDLGVSHGMLIMLLPPGGFIAMGFLLALFQYLRDWRNV